MAGYRSRNALEKRVELGGGYAATIQKLSATDAKALQAIALGASRAKQRSVSSGEDGEEARVETEIDIDLASAAYTDELILRGVKAWDLDDEHGQTLSVRAGLAVLFEDDYNLLVKEIKALSRPVSEREKKGSTNA